MPVACGSLPWSFRLCTSRKRNLRLCHGQPCHCIAGTDTCHHRPCVSDGIGDDKMKRHNPTHASKRARPSIDRTTRGHGQAHLIIHKKLIEGTILSPISSEHILVVIDGIASCHLFASHLTLIYTARVFSAVFSTASHVMI